MGEFLRDVVNKIYKPEFLRDVVNKIYKPQYKWVMRKKNRYERIPGSGEFVSEVIKDSEEKVKYQLPAMETITLR